MAADDYRWSGHVKRHMLGRWYREFGSLDAAKDAFDEAVWVYSPERDEEGRWHPPTEAIFYLRSEPNVGLSPVVTTVLKERSPLIGYDDIPTCPICGLPTDPRRHDPCPWCEDDADDRKWRATDG